MDEVYTCICGEQSWSIHEQFIKCTSCNKEYEVKVESPTDFNAQSEEEWRAIKEFK